MKKEFCILISEDYATLLLFFRKILFSLKFSQFNIRQQSEMEKKLTRKNLVSWIHRRFADLAIHENSTCNICIHGLLVYKLINLRV